MATLESASVDQLRRLLELFPFSLLKEEWPGVKGEKKSDACEIIAGTRDFGRIKTFLMTNFAHCRQHVLLVKKNDDTTADPLAAFPHSDPFGTMPGGISYHLAAVPYTVYLLNPMEQTEVEVLWPIRIEDRDGVLLIRTVVLERDPANYSGRTAIKSIREFDEKKLPNALAELGYIPVDLNKGVKALWSTKYMDAFRVTFKKAKSTSTEVMDEDVGLRENAPEIFDELTSKPLLNTNFKPDPSVDNGIKLFQINATAGRLGFTSYTDDPGDSDEIIKAVLENNR